jgi:nucleotide-binding universal stress UspA family protein
MKILLATDGSSFSQAALSEIIQRPYPPGTEVKIISVVHPWPFIAEPTFILAAAHQESLEQGRKCAAEIVANAAKKISEGASQLIVTTEVLEGSPKQVIVEEAERWGADLVLVGSHGYGPVKRFLLGSVSQAVVLYAPCSVEIVRKREMLVTAASHE